MVKKRIRNLVSCCEESNFWMPEHFFLFIPLIESVYIRVCELHTHIHTYTHAYTYTHSQQDASLQISEMRFGILWTATEQRVQLGQSTRRILQVRLRSLCMYKFQLSVTPRHSDLSVTPRHSDLSVTPRHSDLSVTPRHSVLAHNLIKVPWGYCDLPNKWELLRRSSGSKLVQMIRWKPLKIPIYFASRSTTSEFALIVLQWSPLFLSCCNAFPLVQRTTGTLWEFQCSYPAPSYVSEAWVTVGL